MSFTILILLIIYLVLSYKLAKHLHAKYYYYFNPILNEKGENIHDLYPENKQYNGHFFTLNRIFFGIFLCIFKITAGVFIVITLYLLLR